MTKINSKKAFNWLRNISSGKFNTNSDVNLKCIVFNISLYTSHFIGLLLVIQFPCGLAPLLATGNSSTVPKLFRRYLSTLVHTRKFYESDPFIRGSTSWKTVQQVRRWKIILSNHNKIIFISIVRMHKNVGHLMNTKYSDKLGNKKGIWMNQHGN